MGLLTYLMNGGNKYSDSEIRKVNQKAENLMVMITEALQISKAAPDLETKKSRADYAMKKVIELIKLVNIYPFINTRRLSGTYSAIREIRNEIKIMETARKNPFERREVA